MKPLLLELIGPPRLLSPQGDLLQIGKLPLALLAYLALEKRPVPREHLGGLFWPGSDRSRQFHNLRQAALKIRSIHYEDPLEGNGTLAVKAGFLVTDVEAFYEGVAHGRVAEAVGLWRGPFLQGFRRPESWELEEWADQNRLKLERTLSTSVVTEARRALEAESPSTALSLLDASRKLLPDHLELGTLQAMALAWVGRLPEAEGVLKTLDLDGAPELEGEAAEALAEARRSPLLESPPREVEILEDPASLQDSFPPARRVLPWLLATAAVLLLFLTFTRSHSSDAASLAGDQTGYALLTCTSWATGDGSYQVFRMGFDGNDKHRLTLDRFCKAVWVDEAGSLFGPMADSLGDLRLFQASPNPDNPIAEWNVSLVEVARKLKDPQVARATPAVGADGTLLFSALNEDGNRDIYTLQSLFGELKRLTTSSSVDRWPSVEAGGHQVVFMSDRSGAGDLFSIGLDGTGLERLTDHPLQDGAPWVRGDRVLFVRGRGVEDEDGNMELILLDLKTGTESRLTDNDWNDYEQVWSPDGRYICWQSEEFGHYESEIMVLELSRNSSWNVTNTPGRDSDCLWTPRGNGLVFISYRGGEDSDLYLQELEGGEPLNLTRFPEKETVMGFFALPEALKHPQQ